MAYLRPVDWPRLRNDLPPPGLASNEIYKLWTTVSGGHKWSHYFPIYQEIFSPLARHSVRILEIGVYRGASLDLWRRYFTHPDRIIVGLDIDPDCARFDAPEHRVHVRIGSQVDVAFLRSVVEEFGPFDLIIDDGSHISSHIIGSFNYLFANGLKDPGIYFVEDLHANYWRGWRDSTQSFLDVCKSLIELMHSHYQTSPSAEFLLDAPSAEIPLPFKVPLVTTTLNEIRVFDSVVVLHKARRAHAPNSMRMGW